MDESTDATSADVLEAYIRRRFSTLSRLSALHLDGAAHDILDVEGARILDEFGDRILDEWQLDVLPRIVTLDREDATSAVALLQWRLDRLEHERADVEITQELVRSR